MDLGTADLGDARRFYPELFGWSYEDDGSYTTFLLNGRPVAGAGPLFGEGQPTAWSTYIATNDADMVAARVAANGGKVLVPPFDVHDQGRMAAFLDPGGAPFSVWQAGTMQGAAVFDVPGSLTWNELNTRNLDEAHAFYGGVFGWQFRHSSIGEVPYLVAKLHETAICGIQPMTAEAWPADVSPHWMVYFAVHDCDRSTEHALALGGRVLFAPASLSIGRYSVLADPQGGMFAVLASNR
ncbi:VOC family protein [Paractinoplanes globisporus]|uniref:VOC family protein n=1 Tax=Paractinoplanes globisporus TaxID=113565 RepID=UPI00036F56EE|nr:VOC family protein [Actinoplanes globisporus]